MYVESKPLSTYGATPGWVVPTLRQPSPQPPGTLKRPPVLKSASLSSASSSSASSLSGMEQSIPSFRSFVSRTPTPESNRSDKPLPPTPLTPRRASFVGSKDRQGSFLAPRRGSSIYSRAMSEANTELSGTGAASIRSWRTNDLGDQSNLLLRPIAYSASTSQLVQTKKDVQLLEPRTYAPLITTPSPTASTTSSPSPSPSPTRSESKSDAQSKHVADLEPRPSIVLPPPAGLAKIPKKHLRTVSLEKAKEIMQAAGKEHLLPEELRAQALGRSRSEDPPMRPPGQHRLDSIDVIGGKIPVQTPEVSTLVDSQGRERLMASPRMSVALTTPFEHPLPVVKTPPRGHSSKRSSSINPFMQDKGRAKLRASQMHGRKRSKGKNVPALTIDTGEEPRGRTKVRGQRTSGEQVVAPARPAREVSEASYVRTEDSSVRGEGGQGFAAEYYKLLDDAYQNQSPSVTPQRRDSSTEVMAKMKMVPQPLFHSKPSPAGTIKQESPGPRASSLYGRSNSGTTTFPGSKHGSSDSRGTLPLRLSFSLRPGFNRRSTSGDIPISPPPGATFASQFPRAMSVERPVVEPVVKTKEKKATRGSGDKKTIGFSLSRKSKKEKAKTKGKGNTEPLSAADIMAEKLKSATLNGALSPLRSNPPVPSPSASDASSVHSTESRRPLRQRMLKGAAKYAEKLHRPGGESPARGRKESDDVSPRRRSIKTTSDRPIASPTSPHLLPSPASSKKTAASHISLGWSDTAKFSFDQAHTPPHSPLKKRFEHIATPARPLNESVAHLRDDSLTRRPSTILSGLMESWNERKAERRREDLKKIIKVVTPAHLEAQEDEVAGSNRSGVFAAVSWRSVGGG